MKTILLIDDEPELLELLRYLFKHLNYKVVTFPNVVSVETFENILPDVVILDNNLGVKSGGELCLEIKNNPKTHHIPVVLLSANGRLPEIAKDNHADAFIEKPFDIGNLYSIVKKVSIQEA
ncbi:MAG TPA: response regulator [Mucilaginibacter sp.]|jgi:DNA-binding response OmpR family regulator|nr:response regulator [Mucilaginibacter sp.]